MTVGGTSSTVVRLFSMILFAVNTSKRFAWSSMRLGRVLAYRCTYMFLVSGKGGERRKEMSDKEFSNNLFAQDA